MAISWFILLNTLIEVRTNVFGNIAWLWKNILVVILNLLKKLITLTERLVITELKTLFSLKITKSITSVIEEIEISLDNSLKGTTFSSIKTRSVRLSLGSFQVGCSP